MCMYKWLHSYKGCAYKDLHTRVVCKKIYIQRLYVQRFTYEGCSTKGYIQGFYGKRFTHKRCMYERSHKRRDARKFTYTRGVWPFKPCIANIYRNKPLLNILSSFLTVFDSHRLALLRRFRINSSVNCRLKFPILERSQYGGSSCRAKKRVINAWGHNHTHGRQLVELIIWQLVCQSKKRYTVRFIELYKQF